VILSLLLINFDASQTIKVGNIMLKNEIIQDLKQLAIDLEKRVKFYNQDESRKQTVVFLQELITLIENKLQNYSDKLSSEVDYPDFLRITGGIRSDLANFLREIPGTGREVHFLVYSPNFLKGIEARIEAYDKAIFEIYDKTIQKSEPAAAAGAAPGF
jgi:hypothetical protein